MATSASDFTSFTCIFFIWLSKYLGSLNVFPQAKQENIFIWRWVFMCALQFPLDAKCFSHMLHLNGFWPLWILRCSFSSLTEKKGFSHSGHVMFFSPVCLLSWALRLLLEANLCPQVWHSNGFSFVWILLCSVNCLLHWVFSKSWISDRSRKFVSFKLNFLLLHWNDESFSLF